MWYVSVGADPHMIFDRLCGIVERVYPNEALVALLRRARVFEFPGRPHEVLKGRDWSSFGGHEFLLENFFLPFPVVAIEDTASCVVVADDVSDQRGLTCTRTVIECIDLRAPIDEFGLSRQDPQQVDKWRSLSEDVGYPPGTCSIVVSRITAARVATTDERLARPTGSDVVFEGEFGFSFVANRDELIVAPDDARRVIEAQPDASRYYASALQNAVAALEEVMWFNTPDRFIVERSPDAPLRGKRQPHGILRSAHRPRYIMLRPDEIREKLGIGDATADDRRTPHARRRHYRTLRSDRFINAQGRTLVIAASWVGSSEGEHNGRRYRVCLEL